MADSLKKGYQVMVFVHSRKDTGKSARVLADLAAKVGGWVGGEGPGVFGGGGTRRRMRGVCGFCVGHENGVQAGYGGSGDRPGGRLRQAMGFWV